MQTVNVRYQDWWRQKEKKEVTREEVRAPERQLDDLDDELPCWLRHRVRAKTATVPLARPPCTVGLIVLKLTRQEDSDENLVDGALDVDNGNETQNGV